MPQKSSPSRRKDGCVKYRRALMKVARPFIEKIRDDKSRQAILRDNIRSKIFDAPQQIIESTNRSPEEESLLKIFNGFLEIREAFDVMSDIPVYLQKPFPKVRKISKPRYLRYHVANYFNEIYILRERLKSYKKIVIRLTRKIKQKPDLSSICRTDEIIAILDKPVDLRGEHVHRKRLTNEEFEKLDFLEIISGEESLPFEEMLDSQALRYKAEWVEVLKANNSVIKQLLSEYFHEIYDLTFDRKGQLLTFSRKASD